jgi:hypothetical protein
VLVDGIKIKGEKGGKIGEKKRRKCRIRKRIPSLEFKVSLPSLEFKVSFRFCNADLYLN